MKTLEIMWPAGLGSRSSSKRTEACLDLTAWASMKVLIHVGADSSSGQFCALTSSVTSSIGRNSAHRSCDALGSDTIVGSPKLFSCSSFQRPSSLCPQPSDLPPLCCLLHRVSHQSSGQRLSFGGERQLGVVAKVLNPSTWQAETGGLL